MRVFYFIMLIGLLACSRFSNPSLSTYPVQMTQTTFTQNFLTPELVPSTTSPEPTRLHTPIPLSSSTPEWEVCSPLRDLLLSELTDRITNPFHPPPPGSDDPHEGIDIADLQPGTSIALAGIQVQSALKGRVAMVLQDRFPYGNAILIETNMETMPEGWLTPPTPAPTLSVIPVLTCPVLDPPVNWDISKRSLYVLYAHLQNSVDIQPGDAITCGERLGQVGSSGNALNPHLHLEVRIGPSGVRIPSMAHYTNDASLQEMAWYCTWRVSGWFQLIDPVNVMVDR